MVDIAQVKKDWESRGFSFAVWEDPPGKNWENYVHEVDELLMLLEGELELEMNGKKLRPEIGKEILIPAKVVHCVRTSSKGPSKWLYGYRRK